MPAIILKAGREKSLLRRHPWIFSGAIDHADENIASGGTVDVLSFNQQFLARAAYSANSQIRARVWTFEDEPVDKEFFRRKIRQAIDIRKSILGSVEAMRLLFAESDSIPGLIVDRYGDVLVLQSLTTGIEFWKDTISDLLFQETGSTAVYERSDADVRELEKLEPKVGILRGFRIPEKLTIVENDLKFDVSFVEGQKTGFYLDQRNNRLRVRELAQDKDVLDCFCYTGGFSVNALTGGAKSVLSVDSSKDALALCKKNVTLNELDLTRHKTIEGDVFQLLRKFRDEGRFFDMIILDPPKFAPTAVHANRAARAYKDINLLAFKMLRPGGLLVTFSCSGGVDAALFEKIVAGAALDAGVEAQIVERLSQGPDHPVALNFPEGAYLKGLICLRK